tara:strand:- start:619 stop:1332 length:714 start_codon:yes stop_codon:yes gene_type:complete
MPHTALINPEVIKTFRNPVMSINAIDVDNNYLRIQAQTTQAIILETPDTNTNVEDIIGKLSTSAKETETAIKTSEGEAVESKPSPESGEVTETTQKDGEQEVTTTFDKIKEPSYTLHTESITLYYSKKNTTFHIEQETLNSEGSEISEPVKEANVKTLESSAQMLSATQDVTGPASVFEVNFSTQPIKRNVIVLKNQNGGRIRIPQEESERIVLNGDKESKMSYENLLSFLTANTSI